MFTNIKNSVKTKYLVGGLIAAIIVSIIIAAIVRAVAPTDALIENVGADVSISTTVYAANGDVIYLTQDNNTGAQKLNLYHKATAAISTIAIGNALTGPAIIYGAGKRGAALEPLDVSGTQIAYLKQFSTPDSLEIHVVNLATLADAIVETAVGNFAASGFFVDGDSKLFYTITDLATSDHQLKVYTPATLLTTIATGNAAVTVQPCAGIIYGFSCSFSSGRAQAFYTESDHTTYTKLFNLKFSTLSSTLVDNVAGLLTEVYYAGPSDNKIVHNFTTFSGDSIIKVFDTGSMTNTVVATALAPDNVIIGSLFATPIGGSATFGSARFDTARDRFTYARNGGVGELILYKISDDTKAVITSGLGNSLNNRLFGQADSKVVYEVINQATGNQEIRVYDSLSATTLTVDTGNINTGPFLSFRALDSAREQFLYSKEVPGVSLQLFTHKLSTGVKLMVENAGNASLYFSPITYVDANKQVFWRITDNTTGATTIKRHDIQSAVTTVIFAGTPTSVSQSETCAISSDPIPLPCGAFSDDQFVYSVLTYDALFNVVSASLHNYSFVTGFDTLIENLVGSGAGFNYFYGASNTKIPYVSGLDNTQTLKVYDTVGQATYLLATADNSANEFLQTRSVDVATNPNNFTYNKEKVGIFNDLHTVELASGAGDTIPPDTTIVSAIDGNNVAVPNASVTVFNSMTFTFSGTDNVAVASFECSLDAAVYTTCTSPKNYTGLAKGAHTFSVRAIDTSSNTDPTPATHNWTVDPYDDDDDKIDDDVDTDPSASKCSDSGPAMPGAVYPACAGQTSLTIRDNTYAESQIQSAVRAQDAINFLGSTAVDSAGAVYAADGGNNRVQKFTNVPAYTSQWGTFGVGNGQFSRPTGVAFSAFNSNIYVGDNGNNRVQRFNTAGTYQGQWGTLGTGNGQFDKPQGVAADAAGNIYVADSNNNRIQKFNSTGTFITKWGVLGSGDGQFNKPTGIAVDASNNVYVADTNNHRVQKFDSTGVFLAKWGSLGIANGLFNNPFGIAVDSAGNVYVNDTRNDRIQKFNSTGTFLASYGSFGAADGQFANLTGISVNNTTGHLFIVDIDNTRLQKLTTAGAFVAKVGAVGAGNGQFARAQGLTGTALQNVTWKVCSTGTNFALTTGQVLNLNCASTEATAGEHNIGNIPWTHPSSPALAGSLAPAETIRLIDLASNSVEIETTFANALAATIQVDSLFGLVQQPASDVTVTKELDGSYTVRVKEGSVTILESDTTITALAVRTLAVVNAAGIVVETRAIVADKNIVTLHTVNIGGGSSAKDPLGGAEIKVFDRNNPSFQAVAGGKNPNGSIYGVIYEADAGKLGSCVTPSDGICTVIEDQAGDYLVIVKYVDTALNKTVYVGKPKGPSDFVNGLATKEFQIMKVFKNGVFQGYRGGDKMVVIGSILEMIVPESAVWEGTSSIYPFIFSSDSNWTVDVCAQVPLGYTIVGVYDELGNLLANTQCVQTLVANTTKIVAFQVAEVASPEPSFEATITTKNPKGKVTVHKHKVDDIRKNTFNDKVRDAIKNKVGNKKGGQ